jgi:hypothetical protein
MAVKVTDITVVSSVFTPFCAVVNAGCNQIYSDTRVRETTAFKPVSHLIRPPGLKLEVVHEFACRATHRVTV